MKNNFNYISRPMHLSRSVLGGLIVLAITGSVPAYFASIVVFHVMSSAYTVYADRKNVPHVG